MLKVKNIVAYIEDISCEMREKFSFLTCFLNLHAETHKFMITLHPVTPTVVEGVFLPNICYLAAVCSAAAVPEAAQRSDSQLSQTPV